jgi:hypothetical protein
VMNTRRKLKIARRQSPDDEALPPTWEAVPIQYRMVLIDMYHAGRRAGAETKRKARS